MFTSLVIAVAVVIYIVIIIATNNLQKLIQHKYLLQ